MNDVLLHTFAETKVGSHEDAIRCVEYSPEVNVVITGSWDSSVKLWDPRTPTCTGSIAQPERVSEDVSSSSYECMLCNIVLLRTFHHRCTRWLCVGRSLWWAQPSARCSCGTCATLITFNRSESRVSSIRRAAFAASPTNSATCSAPSKVRGKTPYSALSNVRDALKIREGRVAVEYLDPSPEEQKKKYAFKCHRVKENGVEKIYPVSFY